MTVVAAVAAVAGLAVSVDANEKQASASRERGRVSGAAQRIEDNKNLREQARKTRIRQAQIDAASETQGTSGSSSSIGASSVLNTQVSSNVSRVSGQQLASQGISNLNSDIANAQNRGAIGGAISNIGTSAFDKLGGFDNLFKD